MQFYHGQDTNFFTTNHHEPSEPVLRYLNLNPKKSPNAIRDFLGLRKNNRIASSSGSLKKSYYIEKFMSSFRIFDHEQGIRILSRTKRTCDSIS
jgi:hypothetical protein